MTDIQSWNGSVYIGGWVQGGHGTTGVTSPATGAELARAGVADAKDVDRAAQVAVRAQHEWAAFTPDARAEALTEVRDNLARYADEFSYWLVREAGATPEKARREIDAALGELTFAIELIVTPNIERALNENDRSYVISRDPVGVVGIITPFNAPVVLAMRCIAPALAFGNAVILKPDLRTAVSGGLLFAQLFENTSVPAGLLSVLPGDRDVGERVSEHPEIRSVLFTGSTPAGRAVGAAAGAALKKVGLELGGNNPVIVLADADIEATARLAITSSFLHSGQICMSAGQYYVHEDIYDEFVERFAGLASVLRVGDPATHSGVDMGPVIDMRTADRLTGLIDEAVADGASVPFRGAGEGTLLGPTVLADVSPASRVWADEIFGPIAAVRSFNSLESVVSSLQKTDFGLVAAIHTRDVERAQTIAAQLAAGSVRINDVTNHDNPRTPMVGRGVSGNMTAFGGPEMLDLLTIPKVTSVKVNASL